ncbi:MAG: RRXRR domain-containing protein [Candidatus Hodarchaeota archaeon]
MSVSFMVLNMRRNRLMPSTPQKARKLLKAKKFKVVQRLLFMIVLLFAMGENKQEVELGRNPGYNQSGFSVITVQKELIAGEV